MALVRRQWRLRRVHSRVLCAMPMSGDSFVDGNGLPFEDFRQLGAQKLSAACSR
jgi:hypothetical protein